MILYSKDDCSRCDMLKEKLIAKNQSFTEVKDPDIISAKGIEFLPVLELDGELLELKEANKYINSI